MNKRLSTDNKPQDGQRIQLEDLPPDVRADFLKALSFEFARDLFGIETKTIEQPTQPPAQQTDWKFWKRK